MKNKIIKKRKLLAELIELTNNKDGELLVGETYVVWKIFPNIGKYLNPHHPRRGDR